MVSIIIIFLGGLFWCRGPLPPRKEGRKVERTGARRQREGRNEETSEQTGKKGRKDESLQDLGLGPPAPSSHASLPKVLQDTYEFFQDLAREPSVCEGEGSPRLQPPRFFIRCATLQDLSHDPYKFFKTWSTRVLRCLLRVNLRLERRRIFCPKASSSVDFARILAQNAALPTSAFTKANNKRNQKKWKIRPIIKPIRVKGKYLFFPC